MEYDKNRFDQLAAIIRATAHPVRLFLLEKLLVGRYCVKELTEMVEYDISTVSRHLQQMKASGLIRDEREGNCVYYSIACDCVRRYYESAISILRSNIERTKNILQ